MLKLTLALTLALGVFANALVLNIDELISARQTILTSPESANVDPQALIIPAEALETIKDSAPAEQPVIPEVALEFIDLEASAFFDEPDPSPQEASAAALIEELNHLSTPSPSPTSTPTPSPRTVVRRTLTPSPTNSPTNSPIPMSSATPIPEQSAQPRPAGGLDADKMFALINQYRVSKNLPVFEKDERSCKLAESRAPEVSYEVRTNTMHSGLKNRNLPYWNNENIISYRSEEGAVNWWINDYIHRKQLEGDFKYSCVACFGNSCAQELTNFTPKNQ